MRGGGSVTAQSGEVQWMGLETQGTAAAVTVGGGRTGLKQGFAGSSGHDCGRTGTQGTAGRGRM